MLVLDTGLTIYCLLYMFYLVLAWGRSSMRRLADIRLAWAIFLGGIAISTFCFLEGDIYAPLKAEYDIWVKIGILAMMAALVGFFAAMEKTIPYRTRHVFTLSGAAITVVATLVSLPLTRLLTLPIGALTFVLIVGFFRYLRSHTTDETRLSFQLVSAGVVMGFVGCMLRVDEVYYYLGPNFYTTGVLLLMLGSLLFGSSVVQPLAYDELDWAEQLAAIYVIGRGGTLLFTHQFQRTGGLSGDFAAAGLTGVQDLMKEITGTSGGVNTISIGEYQVLFAYGRVIVTALVCRAAYRILVEKCRAFTQQYELMFGEEIAANVASASWTGMAEKLADTVFMSSRPKPQNKR